MNQRDSIKMTPEQALAYLSAHRSCALATNGHDGYPHLVAMWYIVKDGAIMMTSYARAQKIVNLKRDLRATVLVERGAKYKELRGVMVRGTGRAGRRSGGAGRNSGAHRCRPE
jgi:nitroimidazol reductase NimA-like FMN-containing flavoprotein (pyridoxamine 5'-phosphate oxidase superfamily)